MAPLLKHLLFFPLLLLVSSVAAKNTSDHALNKSVSYKLGNPFFGFFHPTFPFFRNVPPTGNPVRPDFKTEWEGAWRVTVENVGVSAMQLQLMPNNKVVWFDTTALGNSARKLTPEGNCPINFEKGYPDCFAHALEYDADSDETKALDVCRISIDPLLSY